MYPFSAFDFHWSIEDVTKLNAAISSNAELEGKTLEEIMATASGGVFNNAAQVKKWITPSCRQHVLGQTRLNQLLKHDHRTAKNSRMNKFTPEARI